MPNSTKTNSTKTIGEILKSHREDSKVTIKEVSRALKIKEKDIILLEQDSTHLITKHLYLIGLIRSYGQLLKMKQETIEDCVARLSKKSNINKEHLLNFDSEENRNPSKHYLINALLIFIMIYLVLISFSKFKSQNLAITDLIINKLSNTE